MFETEHSRVGRIKVFSCVEYSLIKYIGDFQSDKSRLYNILLILMGICIRIVPKIFSNELFLLTSNMSIHFPTIM